jgi:tetratricopeptide (TPR) repeat protein
MNSTIEPSSYAPSLQEMEKIERPQKKMKSAATIDTVSLLTDIGISNFLLGKHEKAEKCFSQALCKVDGDLLCNESQSISNSLKIERESWSTTMVDDSESDIASTVDTPKEQSQISSSQCIQPRHEYDEGMRAFDGPLQISHSEHTDAISSLLFFNIAQTYVRRGQFPTSQTWFKKALASSPQQSNQSSVNVVFKILHNLGHCCYKIGSHDDAMPYYQRALSMAIQHKLHDTDLAASLNCVGVLLFLRQSKEQEDTEKAMEMLQRSLAIYRTSKVTDCREIATVLNNIGRVHYLWSEYEEALSVYEEALQIRRQLLGSDSIDVAATIYNTGQTYHQLGRLDEAMPFYEDFLNLIARSCLGYDTRDVAIVYMCIAEIHHQRSQHALALLVFKKALDIARASLGGCHSEVASTLNNLGNLCYEMQDYSAAMKYYVEGLEIEELILSPNHPHIITTLTNIAGLYKHQGHFSKALSTYRRIYDMQLETFGKDNLMEVAVTLSSMGLMQYNLRSYDNAFESYQEALRVRRDHYGSENENADVASTLNSLGLVLFKQEVFETAKDCFMESLRIRQNILGPNHRDVAILWYNIATIFFAAGEEDVAVKYYKETLRVERAALGPYHEDVAFTLQHVGQVFQQLGNLDEALQYFNQALVIERKGKDNMKAIRNILNLIGNVHLQQGDVVQMMKYYIEASRIYETDQQYGEGLVIVGYKFYLLSKLHPPCAPLA